MRVPWWRRAKLHRRETCGPSHRRLRRTIGRLADGELDAANDHALALHLLECESCSQELAALRAIKGSLARLADAEPPTLAATRLRRWATQSPRIGQGPPVDVRDPAGCRAETTWHSPGSSRRLIGPTGRHRVRWRVGALIGAVAAVAVTAAMLLQSQGPARDPRTVAALVELSRLQSTAPAADSEVRAGLQGPRPMLELGDHRVSLVRHLVDGREVFVATSDRAFSMPADARPLGRERAAPMLAKRGDIGIVCFSRPVHMLVAGPLPAERLVEIGRQLYDDEPRQGRPRDGALRGTGRAIALVTGARGS